MLFLNESLLNAKIEKYATKIRTICSEWNLFLLSSTMYFGSIWKIFFSWYFFIFLRENHHIVCFVLLEKVITSYTFPWVLIVCSYVSLKKKVSSAAMAQQLNWDLIISNCDAAPLASTKAISETGVWMPWKHNFSEPWKIQGSSQDSQFFTVSS